MQYFTLALFGLSTLAAAAPVNVEGELVARTGGTTVCCPKDKKDHCWVPPKGSEPPKDGGDKYNNCSFDKQIGLINIFLCDILNDITLAVPINVSVPITL